MTENLQTLRLDISDAVATITFDRPDRHNAASFEMFAELADVIDELSDDDAVRAVVLTGSGPHFSAGADLGGFEFHASRDAFEFMHRVNRTYLGLERLFKPVVAAVRGYAFGFGLEITLPCDIVVASETAVFGLPEIRLGLLPAVTLLRGARLMGRRAISHMALTGERLGAERALQIGLCNEVVADDDLDEHVAALARRLAAGPPLAIEVTKRILHRRAADDYDEMTAFMPGLLLSEDLREGRAAFAERRAPQFRGT